MPVVGTIPIKPENPLPEEENDHRRRAEQPLNSAMRRLSLRDEKAAAIHAAAAQAHASIYLADTIAAAGGIPSPQPDPLQKPTA